MNETFRLADILPANVTRLDHPPLTNTRLIMTAWDNGAQMTDIQSPHEVEVLIDKTHPASWRLWVNVGGRCRLRIYDINPETFQTNTYEASHG